MAYPHARALCKCSNERDWSMWADTERSPRYIKFKSSVKLLCTLQSLFYKYEKCKHI